MDSDFPPIDPGALFAGKLRIVRLLGSGGMGAVYEVEHELTKHRRALKLLHSRYKAYPEWVKRFLREGSAAGRIGNPHIAETFDAGVSEDGDPYLVMELLKGETLADLLYRKPKLGISEAAELVRQASTGVQAAHDAGIVHRDLKPENLFVVEQDHRPFVKILDFGVSKFDPQLTGDDMTTTREGTSLGTPLYMPPELVRGEKTVDARSDVYALGVILYECVTGQRPYEANTLPQLAVLIHEANATPVLQLRPDAPPALAEIIHRAMASKPEARFATARELADVLANFTGLVVGPTVGWPGRGAVQKASPPVVKPPAAPSHAMPVSISQPLQPARRSVLPIVLVAVGAAAAIGVGMFVRKPVTVPVTAPSASPASSEIARSAASNPTTATAPAASQQEITAPSSDAGATPHVASKPAPGAPKEPLPGTNPTSVDNAKGKSRVDERGLVKDNPFK